MSEDRAQSTRPADPSADAGAPAGGEPEPAAPGADAEAQAETTPTGADDERLAALEAELAEQRDRALRAQAEAENTRRRAARDVDNAHKFALEKFVGELLPVLDSLEKAIEAARGSDGSAAIVEGVELSLKLALDTVRKFGVEQIDPLGEPFDPQRHEAMASVPNPDAEPNTVMEVIQRGYSLNGRLVRAAMVVVVKAPDA